MSARAYITEASITTDVHVTRKEENNPNDDNDNKVEGKIDEKKRSAETTTLRPRKIHKNSFMEDIVDHFDECRRQEREIARLRLEEDIRHKEAMVRISEEKKQLMDRVVVYDNIIKSMEVFRSALKLYNELKETMSLRQIAFAIPYCIKCFDFPSMTKQEREIFAKRFNDWAITIGLPERLDPDIFS